MSPEDELNTVREALDRAIAECLNPAMRRRLKAILGKPHFCAGMEGPCVFCGRGPQHPCHRKGANGRP